MNPHPWRTGIVWTTMLVALLAAYLAVTSGISSTAVWLVLYVALALVMASYPLVQVHRVRRSSK